MIALVTAGECLDSYLEAGTHQHASGDERKDPRPVPGTCHNRGGCGVLLVITSARIVAGSQGERFR
jgi:hypothetical protein